MNRFLKTRRAEGRIITLMVLAVWLVAFAGGHAFAGQGYLKLVGPTPLRFDPPNTNTLMTLKSVMQVPKLPVATNTATTNLAVQAANPGGADVSMEIGRVTSMTNPVPEVEAVTNQAVGVDNGVAGNNEVVNNISGDASSSASDLLPVATSMITEYLKSNQGQATTNRADRPGATVFVPLQMGFTPPQVSGPVPQSRAVYKSQ